MAGRQGAGKLRATAAALTLPLWLACCAPDSGSQAFRTAAAEAGTDGRTLPAGAPAFPDPRPQAPPPAATDSTGAASAAPGRTHPAPPAGGTMPGAGPAPGNQPAPAPGPATASPAPPAGAAAGASVEQPTPGRKVTAYYVLPDDGGAGGVRFGCNDSLTGIPRSSPDPAEPLAAAMRALLDGSAGPGFYNALSGSTLAFLSGSFDGTTVTVYLSGEIRPDGPCDALRVEAQLTQTAASSVGALRADVYVNGEPLADALGT